MSNLYKLKLSEEIAAELGKNFKTVRKIKKITQEELADIAGISYGSIKRFEQTGNISLLSLIELSRALGLEYAFENLFRVSPNMYTNIDEVK